MQVYLGSQLQLERGALGSVAIAGGVKMKLSAIRFCGNRSMAKGASEDRLAHLSICWRRTPGSPETACRQSWMTGLAGERRPLVGTGEGGGSTEVDLVVVAVVVGIVVSSSSSSIIIIVIIMIMIIIYDHQHHHHHQNIVTVAAAIAAESAPEETAATP